MAGYIGAKVGTVTANAADIKGDISATDTTPEIVLKNTSEEDIEGGREGKITFKGEQSGGEETTLAQIESAHDGTADDEKGDLVFKTNDGNDGASPTERLRLDSAGDMLLSSPDPSFTITNTTHEDTDGGREGTIVFKGEQSGGELSTLAEIEASHDGTADDEKGDLIFRTNDGSDGASPTEAMRIDSDGHVGIGTSTPAAPLDVTKAGGGNFVALFQNTTDATPYGIHVKDAASGANGYPLFQVTNGAGSSTYFRVDSGTGIVTKPNQPVYHYVGGTSLSDNTVVVTKPATAIISSSDYSTSTGRFTAPVAGKYIFTVWGLFYPVDNSNTITVYSRKNGSTYGHNVQANPYYVSTGNQHHTISATSIVDLAANDYHEWAVNRGSNTGNAYVSQWNQSGYLLG